MKKIIPYIGALIVLIFAFIFFSTVINKDIHMDIQLHALAASKAFIGKAETGLRESDGSVDYYLFLEDNRINLSSDTNNYVL